MKKCIHQFFTLVVAVLFSANSVYAAPVAVQDQQDQRPVIAMDQPVVVKQATAQNDPAAQFENQGSFVQGNVNVAVGSVIIVDSHVILEPLPASFRPEPYELNEAAYQSMLLEKGIQSPRVLENGLIEITKKNNRGMTQFVRHYEKWSYTDPATKQLTNYYVCSQYQYYSGGRNTHTEFIYGATARNEYYNPDGKIYSVKHSNILDSSKNYREIYGYDSQGQLRTITSKYYASQHPSLRRFFSVDAAGVTKETVKQFVRMRNGAMGWETVVAAISNISEEVTTNNTAQISFAANLQLGQKAVLEYRLQGSSDWSSTAVSRQTGDNYVGQIPTAGFEKTYEYRVSVVDVIHLNRDGASAAYTLAEQTDSFVTHAAPEAINVDDVSGIRFKDADITWQYENAVTNQVVRFEYREKGQTFWRYADTFPDGENGSRARIGTVMKSNTEYEYHFTLSVDGQSVFEHAGEFKTKSPVEVSTHVIRETFDVDAGDTTISYGVPVNVTQNDGTVLDWYVQPNNDLKLTRPDGVQVEPSGVPIQFLLQNSEFEPGMPASFKSSVYYNAAPGVYRGTLQVLVRYESDPRYPLVKTETIPYEITVRAKSYADYVQLSTNVVNASMVRDGNAATFVKFGEADFALANADAYAVNVTSPRSVSYTDANGVTTQLSSQYFYITRQGSSSGKIVLSARKDLQPGIYRAEVPVSINRQNGMYIEGAQKVVVELTVTGAASPDFEFSTVHLVKDIFVPSTGGFGWIGNGQTYNNHSFSLQGVSYKNDPDLIRVAPDGAVSKVVSTTIGISSSSGGASYGNTSYVPMMVKSGTPAGVYFGTGAASFSDSNYKTVHTEKLDYQLGVSAGGVNVSAGVLPAFKMQAEEIVIPAGQTLEVNGVLDIPAGGTLKLGAAEIHGPFHVDGRIKITKDAIEIDPNSQVTMDGGSISAGGNFDIAGQGANIQILGGNNTMMLMDAQVIEEKK